MRSFLPPQPPGYQEFIRPPLKPCPFCGCPAHRVGGGSSRIGKTPHVVRCVNVLCAVEVTSTTSDSADKKWNTRCEKVS